MAEQSLRARIADLLHLLQFAKIETPSAGDAAQAEVTMKEIERMLASAPAAPAPEAQEPVAWQARFTDPGQQWGDCTKEHHDFVKANPGEWSGYEVRELFATPPAAEQPGLPELLIALGEKGVAVNGGTHGDKWKVSLPSTERQGSVKVHLPPRAPDSDDPYESCENGGWNAALDEVARLNATAEQPNEQRLEILQRLVVVSEALSSTARDERLANMDAGRLVREAIDMLKEWPLAKPADEQPECQSSRHPETDVSATSEREAALKYLAKREGWETPEVERKEDGSFSCGWHEQVYDDFKAGAEWARSVEQPYSTTSDRYRAELYDEVWEKARLIGFGNVTKALAELERRLAAEREQPERGDYSCPRCGADIDLPAPYSAQVSCRACGKSSAATAAQAAAEQPDHVEHHLNMAKQSGAAMRALATISRMARNEACRSGIPAAGQLCTWDAIADMADAALAEPPVAEQPTAIAEAKAWCAENECTPAEFLAHQLLVKRCEVLGRALTWREAIELTALTTNIPEAERDALIALDDAEQPDTVKVPRELLRELADIADSMQCFDARDDAMGLLDKEGE